MGLPKVGPPLPRQPFCFRTPPFVDGAVIAGQKHIRNAPAFPFLRLGIVRMFKQAGLKALGFAGHGIAHDAGQEPDDRIENDDCRSLAAGEDIIADRDFFEIPGLDQPFVHPFETSAKQDRARTGSKFAHPCLT